MTKYIQMKRFNFKFVNKYCHNVWTFSLIMTIMVSYSCNQNEKSFKSFYFPFEKLKKGLVYKYESLNGKPPEYWMYFSKEKDGQLFFRSVNVTPSGKRIQEVIEKEISNGIKMMEYNIFQYDSTGRQMTQALEISSPASFSYAIKDTANIFIFKAKLEDPFDPNIITTITKNKKFGGYGTFKFNNQEVPIIKIDITELIEQEKKDDGFLEPPSYHGVEWYAKGIGLVYYKKEINENFIMEYQLKKIMTKAEFELMNAKDEK